MPPRPPLEYVAGTPGTSERHRLTRTLSGRLRRDGTPAVARSGGLDAPRLFKIELVPTILGTATMRSRDRTLRESVRPPLWLPPRFPDILRPSDDRVVTEYAFDDGGQHTIRASPGPIGRSSSVGGSSSVGVGSLLATTMPLSSHPFPYAIDTRQSRPGAQAMPRTAVPPHNSFVRTRSAERNNPFCRSTAVLGNANKLGGWARFNFLLGLPHPCGSGSPYVVAPDAPYPYETPNMYTLAGCGSVVIQRRILDLTWLQNETIKRERKDR